MTAQSGTIINAGRILLFLASLVAGFPALAQEAGAPISVPDGSALAPQPQMSVNPPPDANASATEADPTLTTHETAVECAMALIIESAGQRHMQVGDPAGNSFKAGLCAGKIQTYMLRAKADNPSCFPKIELEEGMRMFVKWAEAHPEESTTIYPDGLKNAFEDAIPCLKK